MLLILLMSKGSKEVLTVLIVTYVTHVKRVESGVCGLCTQYRYIKYYVERVERLCYVEKIGPSGLSCFKDMDICHVISCTSCESKGDFVEHLSCYKLHQL